MKNKLSNITGIAVFIILLPFIYVANKILDIVKEVNVKTDLPESENENNFIKKAIEKTTYPDDYDPEKFDEWTQYISRQRNKYQIN